jgi:sugar lactone lactonase YvrE
MNSHAFATSPIASQFRPFALGCLMVAIAAASAVTARGDSPVEFVVGGLMPSEGGTWSPASSPLKAPFGVDFDSTEALYVVELYGGRVHRLPPGGELETISRNATPGYAGDGGELSQAQFNGMHNGVISARDELLISDSWNHCVRRVDLKTQRVDTMAGTGAPGFSGDGGPGTAATFDYLMCVALNPSGTVLHITDLKNRRIRDLELATGLVRTVAGNGKRGVPVDGSPSVESPLVDPRAAVSDAQGNLYILERDGHALRVVKTDGTIHTVAGTGKSGFQDGPGLESQFAAPKHIECDPSGNVYIADDENRAIRKYDPRTGHVTTILGRGKGDARIKLEHPHGVQWHQGDLYVVDTGNNRILRIKAIAEAAHAK